MKKSKM